MVLPAEPPDISMPGPITRVERVGARRVDQRHRPLGEAMRREEGVVGVGEHVDDGIADADDIEGGCRHD